MGAEICELRFIGFPSRRLEWEGDLRVAHIKRVEKRLMMDERSVIDIERDFANQGERVFAILVVEDSYIFCDQTTERIQREASDVSFYSAFV